VRSLEKGFMDKSHRGNRQDVAVKGDLRGHKWVAWHTKSDIARSAMKIAREAGYQAEPLSNRATGSGCTQPRSLATTNEAAYR
jgi:hypothetical protein